MTWRAFDKTTRQWTSTRAGFIQLPSGSISEDPAGTAEVRVRGSAFYDLAAHTWVPVRREAVSPDGSLFAYVDSTTGIHLVTVSSGNDRVLLAEEGWAVVEFGSDAIYLAKAERIPPSVFGGTGFALKGLYRQALTGGSPRQLLSSSIAYFTLGKGYGWGLALEGIDAPPRQLLRIDLQSGVADAWYRAPDTDGIGQLAMDASGNPVVGLVVQGRVRLLRIEARDRAQALYDGPEQPRPQGRYAIDSAGLWLSTFTSVEPFDSPPWFVDTAGRVHQLPSVAPNSVEIAGGCH